MTDIVLKVLYICSLIYSPQRLYQAVLTLFQWLVNCLKKAVSRSHIPSTITYQRWQLLLSLSSVQPSAWHSQGLSEYLCWPPPLFSITDTRAQLCIEC